MADLTDKQLQIKEDMARSILQVADKIIPGNVRWVVEFLARVLLIFMQKPH